MTFEASCIIARALELDARLPGGLVAHLEPEIFEELAILGVEAEDLEDTGDFEDSHDAELEIGVRYELRRCGSEVSDSYVGQDTSPHPGEEFDMPVFQLDWRKPDIRTAPPERALHQLLGYYRRSIDPRDFEELHSDLLQILASGIRRAKPR